MGFFEKLFGGKPEYRIMFWKNEFEPKNPLEQTLKLLIEGKVDIPAVMRIAIASKVFLPSTDEAKSLKDRGFKPLVFDHPGIGPMIAAFTDGDRFDPVRELFRPVHSALEVEFSWVAQFAPEELGIVINPGWEVGLVMPADGLAQFRRDMKQTGDS